MRRLIAIVALLILAGCQTPYQPMGFSGGYVDQPMGDDVFMVSVAVNGFTPAQTAQNYFHQRASEIVAENGYARYEVLSADTKMHFEEAWHKENYQIAKPQVLGYIKCFRGGKGPSGLAPFHQEVPDRAVASGWPDTGTRSAPAAPSRRILKKYDFSLWLPSGYESLPTGGEAHVVADINGENGYTIRVLKNMAAGTINHSKMVNGYIAVMTESLAGYRVLERERLDDLVGSGMTLVHAKADGTAVITVIATKHMQSWTLNATGPVASSDAVNEVLGIARSFRLAGSDAQPPPTASAPQEPPGESDGERTSVAPGSGFTLVLPGDYRKVPRPQEGSFAEFQAGGSQQAEIAFSKEPFPGSALALVRFFISDPSMKGDKVVYERRVQTPGASSAAIVCCHAERSGKAYTVFAAVDGKHSWVVSWAGAVGDKAGMAEFIEMLKTFRLE